MAGIVTVPLLVYLLVPSLGHPPEVFHNATSKNNLKQFGLAFHNYLAANGAFPARTIRDSEGKPLLSWRVAILPYLESDGGTEAFIYSQFHLDEPWDSSHNRALVEKMPAVFANPGDSNLGETHYLAVVGKGTLFGAKQAAAPADVTDGLSNTIMLVEADRSAIWTKPDDWEYDAGDPKQGVGSMRRDGFNILFADGGVKFILNSVDVDALKALVTMNGGEDVNLP